jgi:hypothetical protein
MGESEHPKNLLEMFDRDSLDVRLMAIEILGETGDRSSFQATFNIPASLQGSFQIAIGLESPTSGYYSYNCFYYNNVP